MAPSPPKSNQTRHARSDSDPLTRALAAPVGESPQQRQQRLEQEAQAKKISDAIDEQLRKEKAEKTKKTREVKILLLGQSESGKSTTLKQFQLLYAPNSFQVEAPSWRPIVYLNLVRSVRRILEVLTLVELDSGERDSTDAPFSPTSPPGSPNPRKASVGLSSEELAVFAKFRYSLSPLLTVEDKLIRLLSDPDEDSGEATHLDRLPWNTVEPNPNGGSAFGARPNNLPAGYVQVDPPSSTGNAFRGSDGREVWVGGGWKRALGKLSKKKSSASLTSSGHGSPNGRNNKRGGNGIDWTLDPDDPVHVLLGCKSDMIALWRDPRVRDILRRRRVRVEESPGFYLDDVERVTAPDYIPSIDDVLKARLKTLGVVEHRFSPDNMATHKFARNPNNAFDWLIYDVGGARNQRHVWAPFFDDVQALIFLAPISAFDQVLTEDPNVNRMEDSLLLWRSLVANKLLKNVNFILFLNKCDLLRKKMDAGVKLKTYMPSYGERPNDYDSISNYFRTKFAAMHQSYTPNPERDLYIHMTSVTDTASTESIIINVRDMLLRDALKGTALI